MRRFAFSWYLMTRTLPSTVSLFALLQDPAGHTCFKDRRRGDFIDLLIVQPKTKVLSPTCISGGNCKTRGRARRAQIPHHLISAPASPAPAYGAALKVRFTKPCREWKVTFNGISALPESFTVSSLRSSSIMRRPCGLFSNIFSFTSGPSKQISRPATRRFMKRNVLLLSPSSLSWR